MTKWFLVYKGIGVTRDGREYKRTRVVRLGDLEKPVILDVELDEPTRRGIITIGHVVRIPRTTFPRTTYYRNGTKVSRKRYTRGSYKILKKFQVPLGDMVKGTVRLTRRPPKGPLHD